MLAIVSLIFSCLAAGWVAFERLGPPASISRGSEPRVPVGEPGEPVWRRTVDGWERADLWFRPTLADASRIPHPLVVGSLQLLLSLMALIGWSSAREQRAASAVDSRDRAVQKQAPPGGRATASGGKLLVATVALLAGSGGVCQAGDWMFRPSYYSHGTQAAQASPSHPAAAGWPAGAPGAVAVMGPAIAPPSVAPGADGPSGMAPPRMYGLPPYYTRSTGAYFRGGFVHTHVAPNIRSSFQRVHAIEAWGQFGGQY